MQVIITAVGPDNRGLADPIVHHVTSAGANISEIQMYDHDAERALRHAAAHGLAGGAAADLGAACADEHDRQGKGLVDPHLGARRA